MISQGLIEESGHSSASEPGSGGREERRRYYRITGSGRRVAAAEAARLEGLVRTARARGLLPGVAGDVAAAPEGA